MEQLIRGVKETIYHIQLMVSDMTREEKEFYKGKIIEAIENI
jgi:hypothetical protein